METTKLKKIEELTSLITLLNRNVSKEDFAANFKIIIDLIKELKIANRKEMDFLSIKYDSVVNAIKEDNKGEVENIKKQVFDYCLDQIDRMVKGYKVKMSEIDAKLASIRDGKDADETIIVSKASKMAQDALKPDLLTIKQVEDNLRKQGDLIANTLEALPDKKKLEISAIKDLKKELEEIRELKGRLGGGGGFSLMAMTQHFIDDEIPVDSGDHLNFTINHTPVNGTFKLYRSRARQNITEDYTLSGRTLTLTVAFDSTNESLFCDYIK